MSIKCGNCSERHASVAEVKACHAKGKPSWTEAQEDALWKQKAAQREDAQERQAYQAKMDRDDLVARLGRHTGLRAEQIRITPSTDDDDVFARIAAADDRRAEAERRRYAVTPAEMEQRDWRRANRPARIRSSEARRIPRDLDQSDVDRDAEAMRDAYRTAAVAADLAKVKARKPVESDGMYRNPETGEIFKVQMAVHGSGNLYAKQLFLGLGDNGGQTEEITRIPLDATDKQVWTMDFRYVAGAIRKLDASWKMSLADAKEFGALYGVCCNCGRTLTDEGSIEAGIGPVCAGRFE